MARTKEELRDLVAVLRELKATANLGIDADLEKMNQAISKIGKGQTSGFRDLITSAQDIKRVLRDALEVNPEGIYKVNRALAETVNLARQLEKAPMAMAGLAGQEKNQLRYLQSAPAPASIARQLQEEANNTEIRNRYYKASSDNEYVNTRLPVVARKEMNADFEKRAQPFLTSYEEVEKANKEASAKQKELTQKDEEVRAQANRAMNELVKATEQEAKERQANIAKARDVLDQSKRLGQKEDEADKARLRKLGEETYANPNAVNVGIDRSSYNAEQAAAATQKGEEAAVKKQIAEKETVADLQQQKLLQQEITKLQEEAFRKANPQAFNPNVRSAESMRMEASANAEYGPNQLNQVGAVSAAFGNNTAKLEEFQKRLHAIGFDLKDINTVSKDAVSGITTMSASVVDANGVLQQATVHVDRFGQVVQSQSNNFRTFGDILANNVKKVLEWTVAIGLVYGAIAKLQEVFSNMSELQNLLNDLTITANLSGEALQNAFDGVVEVSNKVGISAVDSLKAMNYALKITGESSVGAERTSKALTLLTASLTLSKLSGMGQAEAMDELVASLEQANLSIDQATSLLDKFQAVAKVSGGSIDDMTTTFGITAASAMDLGISIDQLNGIIGAFASITTKSAEETGNALKVIFSNIQTDKAIAVFQKYGIAVKDFATGETRNFIDIMDELNDRIKTGLVDDRGLSEIALKVSGGSRRAADFTAITKNWEKVAPTVQVSAKAQGDAQAALEIKSQTLNSAVQRLNNSFLELSNTLGDKGGFVDLMTQIVSVMDSIVKVANSVTSALGPMTTAITALAAISIGNKLFGNQIKEVFTGLGSSLVAAKQPQVAGANVADRVASIGAGNAGFVQVAEQGGKAFGDKAVGGIRSFIGGGFGSALVPVIGLSLVSAMQGNGVQAAAGLVSGAFMAGVTKSAGWASIGAIVAQIIVSQIQSLIDYNNKGRAAVEAGVPTYEQYKTTNPKATPEEYQTEVKKRIQDIANSPELFGNVAEQIATGMSNTDRYYLAQQQKEYLTKNAPNKLSEFEQAGKSGDYQRYSELYKELEKIIMSAKLGVGDKSDYFGARPGINRQLLLTANNLEAIDVVSRGLTESFKELNDVAKEATTAENNKYKSQVAFNEAFGNRSIDSLNKFRTELIMQMGQAGSQITSGPQYKSALAQGGVAQVLTPQVLAAQHPEVKAIGEAKKFSQEYDTLFETLSRANEERVNFIGELATEISRLNDQISTGKSTQIALDRQQLAEDQKLLAVQLQLADVEAARSQVVYQGFDDQRELTKKEVLKAARDAEKVQNYVVGQMGIDPGLFKKTLDDIYVLTKDGLVKIKGLGKDFFSPAIDGVKQMKKELENAFNFQNLRDYPIDVAGRLQKAMNYYQNLLKQWGLNEKIEKMTFLFKDNQVAQLVGSQTALQLALQDLTQVEKKQLDGIYNLPSGATAFIPLQAGQMLANNTANNVGAAPYDYGNFPTPALTGLTDSLTGLDSAVLESTNSLKGFARVAAEKYQREAPELKERPRDLDRNGNPYKDEIQIPYALPKPRAWDWSQYQVPGIEKSQGDVFSQLESALVQPIQSMVASIKGLFNIQKTGGTDMMKERSGFGNETKTVNVTVKPEKVTNEFSTNIILRLDGRTLATAMKKYLFEDYQRLTASVGRTSRSTTGVI